MKRRTNSPSGRRTVNAAAARVAFMRLGIGPKAGSLARLGTSATAARDACLRELSNPKAALLPDSAVTLTGSNGVTYPLTVANCCNAAFLKNDNMLNDFPIDYMDILPRELAARLVKHLEPEVGFVERLVLFWSNHFSIYNFKSNLTRATVGNLERNVIRTHVLGNFYDMLLGVTMHPAMLTYLDNTRSVGPNSTTGKKRGLTYNENLAREILELHTVGVNGGYSQADVTNFAKVLTGWKISGALGTAIASTGPFLFDPDLHEPGSFVVMGKTFIEQSNGVDQGIAVLKMLATHPATAQHIAYKLLRHFVSDTPDPQDVAIIARNFQSSGGNLLTVAKALVALPSVWSTQMTRIRQPHTWLASMARALAIPPAQITTNIARFSGVLGQMGQAPFGRLTPDGYPDDNYYWFNPDAVRLRKDIALNVVGNYLQGPIWSGGRPPDLATNLLGTALSADSAAVIASFSKDDRQALALLFSTPEYLRR